MNRDYAETYEEHKSGKYEYVKGYGRLGCYQGLDYIENILKDDKYYSEELEDSFIFIQSYINWIEQQCKKQQDAINKAIELTNNFAFKILTDNRTMYIRLKDLEQGKDLLDILKDKEV